MAIHIFLILNVLSIGFLVYVLAQFWREGRRARSGAEPVMVFSRRWDPNAIVMTHPMSLSAHAPVSARPLQARERAMERDRNATPRVLEMPARKRAGSPRPGALDSKIKVC
jgi:hypothetical protein